MSTLPRVGPRSAHRPAPAELASELNTARELDAAGELSTVDAMAEISFLVQEALERRAGGRGFSLVQTRLLGVLRDRRPTINELADLLGLDKSSVSGLVDRAERRGLLKRTRSAVDRRSVLVELSEDGRALVGEVAAQFEADIAAMLEPLTPTERAALTSLVSRVLLVQAGERRRRRSRRSSAVTADGA
jgi:MarR family transcriptional regulator, lower aerobic nicotinate degradation pathway regulator